MRSLVAARRMATCKRCGDEQCAWYKTKAGKWMLCQAYEVAGSVAAQIFNPHKCQQAMLDAKAGKPAVAATETLAEKWAKAEAESPLTDVQRKALAPFLKMARSRS